MNPQVLVCTSESMSAEVATPFLAALEVVGTHTHALELGRVNAVDDSTLGRFVQVFRSEIGERRLGRELLETQPDVAVAFDPGACVLLEEARRTYPRPYAIAAIAGEVDLSSSWGRTSADRYLCLDDHAAVMLSEQGVPGHRVVPVGVFGESQFAQVGRESRTALRRRFKLPASEPVVVVDVAGSDVDSLSQLAMQLSLVKSKAMFLFDAGDDSAAAQTLRESVPALDLRAKLFGNTDDRALLWRSADVVVGLRGARAITRAMQLGALLVMVTAGDGALSAALAERGRAHCAASLVQLSSVLGNGTLGHQVARNPQRRRCRYRCGGRLVDGYPTAGSGGRADASARRGPRRACRPSQRGGSCGP